MRSSQLVWPDLTFSELIVSRSVVVVLVSEEEVIE